MIELNTAQIDAVNKMHDGCILCGGVGSGKSRTALAYWYKSQGGTISFDHTRSDDRGITNTILEGPCDLYIITTAKKRDTMEWDSEMAPLRLSQKPELNYYSNKVVVDSWNNIQKYDTVKDSFFIFDEQRVVGKGAWVKTFLHIAKPDRHNRWILLSATPGDKWEDYIPVFIANGFYKNRTDFNSQHVIWAPYVQFPKIDRYVGTKRLERLRDSLLVDIRVKRATVPHHEYIYVDYDREAYKAVSVNRWDPFKDEPIVNASQYCYCLRRLVNTDISRQIALLEILEDHPKAIIFYNLTAELDLLRSTLDGLGFEVAECNGEKHQPVPESDRWCYLVQYQAGAEGWNCITTNCIIFFSPNYSYRIMEQAAGRIDRLNTNFVDLWYYHLQTHSGIDNSIQKALKAKKKFNETKFSRSFIEAVNDIQKGANYERRKEKANYA